ncbi:UvrB/UvrC motif-containing protein [Synergistaceae bacterium OttesenSCG-928-I11]|nr:UvrB/UvrC motif-containing protein [Synergistaceae bacterium OttesenSCG-928-I11]
MICSNCGKREVEVLIKQVINQEVHNLNLCRVCAEQMGFISPDTPSITISFSLSDAEPVKAKKKKNVSRQRREEQENALTCSGCGMIYGTFRETGLLGCAECYESFRFPLGAYLQEVQGAESHWGGMSEMFSDIVLSDDSPVMNIRAARNVERNSEVERIRSEIEEAVANEEYERAAELRDRLKPLLADKTEEKNDV